MENVSPWPALAGPVSPLVEPGTPTLRSLVSPLEADGTQGRAMVTAQGLARGGH